MTSGVAGGLLAEIERAFAEEYGLGAPPRMTRTIVALPYAKMAEYGGRYVGIAGTDTLQVDVSIAANGKTLSVFTSSGRRAFPLAPVGGDAFVGLEGGGEWAFERAGDAKAPVRSVALGSGRNKRVLKRQ